MANDSLYDKIFDKVVASSDKLFKIEVPNKTMEIRIGRI